MSTQPITGSPARNFGLDTSSFSPPSPSTSLWDRVSTWASENKAVVYSIAGIAVVVTGAGAVYYLSDSRKEVRAEEEKKRASKKDRRRAKKEKEKEQAEPEKAPASIHKETSGRSD